MSDVPIYRQIMNKIMEMIESGELPYGSKLPAERDLAAQLHVSRGTVKKAFSELERAGVISIIWGSGAYVLKKNASEESPEHELSEAFFGALADMGLTPNEAWEFAEIKHSKAFKLGNVRLALIHVCPECLAMFSVQLAGFKGLKINTYLMDDLAKYTEPKLIFNEIDIILTTKDYFEEVFSMLPMCGSKIFQLNAAPSKETQIDFIKIMNFEKSGLISSSRAFRDIVNEYVETKGYRYGEKDHIIDKWADRDEFDAFVADKRHLVMPPLYSLELQPEVYEGLFEFLRRGGDVIVFDYVIERGSLLYIDERIMEILYGA